LGGQFGRSSVIRKWFLLNDNNQCEIYSHFQTRIPFPHRLEFTFD
jgi:hypothetical protein